MMRNWCEYIGAMIDQCMLENNGKYDVHSTASMECSVADSCTNGKCDMVDGNVTCICSQGFVKDNRDLCVMTGKKNTVIIRLRECVRVYGCFETTFPVLRYP